MMRSPCSPRSTKQPVVGQFDFTDGVAPPRGSHQQAAVQLVFAVRDMATTVKGRPAASSSFRKASHSWRTPRSTAFRMEARKRWVGLGDGGALSAS